MTAADGRGGAERGSRRHRGGKRETERPLGGGGVALRLLKTPNMSRLGDRAEALPGSRHREVKACRSHKSLGVNVDRSFSASPTWGAAQPFLLGERSNHVATPGDATRYGRDTNLMIDTFDESPVCVCGGAIPKGYVLSDPI